MLGYKDTIKFVFSMVGGDSVVNLHSQLGTNFSDNGNKVLERVMSVRSAVEIDTIFGHNIANHFHGEILFRKATSDKVIEYLNK